jgi:hypothetical protein
MGTGGYRLFCFCLATQIPRIVEILNDPLLILNSISMAGTFLCRVNAVVDIGNLSLPARWTMEVSGV